MMEVLTLVQTQKLAKKMAIVVYGSAYWNEVINFQALVKHGMISAARPEPVSVCRRSADRLRATEDRGSPSTPRKSDSLEMPAFAKSRNPQRPAGTA